MENKQTTREPILMTIYWRCMREAFPAAFLQNVLLHYDPQTLHRLSVSGRTMKIRETAAYTLNLMGQ